MSLCLLFWTGFCLLFTTIRTDEAQERTQTSAAACNYSTIWVDVIFLFDGSEAMGEILLESAWAYASSILSELTIEYDNCTESNYTSRLGIITYGDKATVYRGLGTVNNKDVSHIPSLPYNGNEGTNLEDGIRAAIVQFDGANHRPNARQIIVIMAATFYSGGQSSPLQIANTFKTREGIIIVYNMFKLGANTHVLQEIASVDYFLAQKGGSHQDLPDALCDANCFCPSNSASYLGNARGSPIAGCFTVVNIPQNFKRANMTCGRSSNGMIAFDETVNKTTFLTNLMPKSSFYIGLQWNDEKMRWEWLDGTPLSDYHPWEGEAPLGSNSTCVVLTPTNEWSTTDCRNPCTFSCQSPVCSPHNYCSENE